MTTLHPSGHRDPWAREQLPPMAEWPVLRLDGPYAYPARLNCATRLLDDAIDEGHGKRIALVVPDGVGKPRASTMSPIWLSFLWLNNECW